MAHEHLRSQPVAVALAAEVADAALAPVEALIPRGAADYLRERLAGPLRYARSREP